MNIIEFIDAQLPQNEVSIFYRELPKGEYGLLIEETAINARIKSFEHYAGEIVSTIQLYLRLPSTAVYKDEIARLKRYYTLIKGSMGSEVEGLKLLWVEPFLLNDSKDEKGNNIFSMIFEVIYKE